MSVSTQAVQEFGTRLSNIAYTADQKLVDQVQKSVPEGYQNLCINVLRSPGHTVAVVFTLLATPVSTFLVSCFWIYRTVVVLTPAVKALLHTHNAPGELKGAEVETVTRFQAELARMTPALFFGACLVTAVALTLFVFELNFLAFCTLPLSITAAICFGKASTSQALPTPWSAPVVAALPQVPAQTASAQTTTGVPAIAMVPVTRVTQPPAQQALPSVAQPD
jgi:hypothetical protein